MIGKTIGWTWSFVLAGCAVALASNRLWIPALFLLLAIIAARPLPILAFRLANLGIGGGVRASVSLVMTICGFTAAAASAEPIMRDASPTIGIARVGGVSGGLDTTAAFRTAFRVATEDCDLASRQVARDLQSGDRSALYAVAKDAEGRCATAADRIRQIAPGDQASVGETRARCATAYRSLSASYRSMRNVMDGDMRRSSVIYVQQSLESAGAMQQACTDRLADAAAG